MDIGPRLFELRQASKQSLQAVAQAVGISKAHVWELEKGHSKNPSFDLVQRLASHFGVSVGVLTGEADQPEEKETHITRLHRDLSALSEADRLVVQDMIEVLKKRSEGRE